MKNITVLNGGPSTCGALNLHDNVNAIYFKTSTLALSIKNNQVSILSKNEIVTDKFVNTIIFNRYAKHEHMCGILLEFSAFNKANIINPSTLHYNGYPDKCAQLPRLALHNVSVPDTIILEKQALENSITTVENTLSYPIVLKKDGECGDNVHLCNNKEELCRTIKKWDDDEVISLQEYIPNTYDIRIVAVKNKIIGAIKRENYKSFLNNVAKGGIAKAYNPTKTEENIAVKSLAINGFDFGGVDIIHDQELKPKVIEVNYGLGVKGFESVYTEKRIFTEIAKYL